jgi:uncharacterized membrane protein YdbT with pleckstrin-like domain
MVGVPARLLADGEIVILAIKPSGWFILLHSLPMLAGAVVVAAAVWCFKGRLFGPPATQTAVLTACTTVACAAVLLSGLGWMSRLYVLTDRRVLRVHGLLREKVCHCPLRELAEVTLAASALERLLGIGSLYFRRSAGPEAMDWLHIARCAEVRQIVTDAINRAR